MDAVLTWVDGNDPELKAKRQKYLTDRKEDRFEDIAGRERYVQSNEICFAVGSVLRFAPYIDRILIVTDNQHPPIDEFIRLNFPGNKVEIRIIDHKTIFAGEFDSYRPVFNSLSIEVLLYRIPDLSEEFVYLNDDVFFASPSKREDFFRNGRLVCHTESMNVLTCKILRAIRVEKDGHKRLTFKDTLLNSALMTGSSRICLLQHKPHPLLKSVLKSYLEDHPEAIVRNVRHRFRDSEQFNVQELCYLLAEAQGLLVREKAKGTTLMVRKTTGKKGYLERKLREADKSGKLLYGCINSVHDMSTEEKAKVTAWLCERIGVRLPGSLAD